MERDALIVRIIEEFGSGDDITPGQIADIMEFSYEELHGHTRLTPTTK
jgi:hypothetical protein